MIKTYRPIIFGVLSKSGNFLFQFVVAWAITKHFRVEDYGFYVVITTIFITIQCLDFGLINSFLYLKKYQISFLEVFKKITYLWLFWVALTLLYYFYTKVNDSGLFYSISNGSRIYVYMIPYLFLNLSLLIIKNYQIAVSNPEKIYRIESFSFYFSTILIFFLSKQLAFQTLVVYIFYLPILIQLAFLCRVEYFFSRDAIYRSYGIKKHGLFILQIFSLIYSYLPVYFFTEIGELNDASIYSVLLRIYSVPLIIITFQFSSYQHKLNRIYDSNLKNLKKIHNKLTIRSLLFCMFMGLLLWATGPTLVSIFSNGKLVGDNQLYGLCFFIYLMYGGMSAVNSIILTTLRLYKVQVISHLVATLVILSILRMVYLTNEVHLFLPLFFLVQFITQVLIYIYFQKFFHTFSINEDIAIGD